MGKPSGTADETGRRGSAGGERRSPRCGAAAGAGAGRISAATGAKGGGGDSRFFFLFSSLLFTPAWLRRSGLVVLFVGKGKACEGEEREKARRWGERGGGRALCRACVRVREVWLGFDSPKRNFGVASLLCLLHALLLPLPSGCASCTAAAPGSPTCRAQRDSPGSPAYTVAVGRPINPLIPPR